MVSYCLSYFIFTCSIFIICCLLAVYVRGRHSNRRHSVCIGTLVFTCFLFSPVFRCVACINLSFRFFHGTGLLIYWTTNAASNRRNFPLPAYIIIFSSLITISASVAATPRAVLARWTTIGKFFSLRIIIYFSHICRFVLRWIESTCVRKIVGDLVCDDASEAVAVMLPSCECNLPCAWWLFLVVM